MPASGNSNLNRARKAKNDEFYTQWAYIEREINAYLEYDPDVFRDKVVLLPCDDPEWSNFTKFFALHFEDYGLKKLISTSYAFDSNDAIRAHRPTSFETEATHFDAARTKSSGRMFVLERKDINNDGVVNIDDLQWSYLDGDGDFLSEEVTSLRDEADIVITNPPFSLFRKFVTWLQEGSVGFSIIGDINMSTYTEIFRLIQDNQMWYGSSESGMVFGVPKGADISKGAREAAERGGYAPDDEYDYTHLGKTCWYTNLEHGRRHEHLQLMTMADNITYSKWKEVRDVGYRRYDNFDGIDVPRVGAIPSDYDGMMGVPVTFLNKYNPEQFEILFSAEDMAEAKKFGVEPLGEKRVADYYAAGSTGSNSKGHHKLFLYEPKPHVPYKRVVIRRRS